MDKLTSAQRSWNMARISSRNTAPEMAVRRLLHRSGYRFRLHDSTLPGKPDVVFRRRRRVLLVHGCYWHRHPGCRYAFTPKTRGDFWTKKFARNVERDRRVIEELEAKGWRVLIVWGCETRCPEPLSARLGAFLGAPKLGEEMGC